MSIVQRYLKTIIQAARKYDQGYRNKAIVYYYLEEDGSLAKMEVTFKAGNFMHLCGVVDYIGRTARQFFLDALKGRLNLKKIKIRSVTHFEMKMDAILDIDKLIKTKNVGIVDTNVVYQKMDLGKMVRLKGSDEGSVAIGTRKVKEGSLVPLSLINIPLARTEVKRQMKTWKPVVKIEVNALEPG